MTKITRQEALRIGWLSRIALPEKEIEHMIKGLEEVVTYAYRVCDIAVDVTIRQPKNVNVFREDMISSDDDEAIRAQAPERIENFYVVPAVIETKE